MMKREFEERVGVEISDKDYEIVQQVYTYHPAIGNAEGKDQIATLFKIGGMPLIYDMLEVADAMCELAEERSKVLRRLEEINERTALVKKGDLTNERCRKDARELFIRAETSNEWELGIAFLGHKYGEKIAKKIAKEVEG